MKYLLIIPILFITTASYAECTDEEVTKIVEIRQLEAQKRTIERYEIDVTTEKQEIEDRMTLLKSQVEGR